ncbi:MAG: Na/Pi cotransporter family protein [Aliiglaciecola sp.]
MEYLNISLAAITAVVLFVFGLEHFSQEIERFSGERFRKSISAATKLPVVGVLLGALVTMVIQSSSATSVITISLVNAGVLSFKNSVGIIFGSNIGTTITAQLVAFKLTNFAPFFIVLGFFLSLLNSRASIFGKAIFYFGFVFFSLQLVSDSLSPLQQNTYLMSVLTEPQNPIFALLIGALFTALVQSSSVTTGLAIVFTQQGMIGLENAVPLIMGANIGTTVTAFIAVFNMDIAAKKAALSHLLFNLGGVLMFIPILLIYGHELEQYRSDPAVALATIHLVFNVVTSIVFTFAITPFTRLIDYIMGEGKMDFERLNLPVFDQSESFESVKEKLDKGLPELFDFMQENYNVVTLSIETNFRGILHAAEKRLQYTDFVKKEFLHYFSSAVTLVNEPAESKEFIRLFNQYDYLFQIHDSIKDLHEAKRGLDERFIEMKSDLLLMTRSLSSLTLEYFHDIAATKDEVDSEQAKTSAKALQHEIDEANRTLLSLMLDSTRADVGVLTNFMNYSQRLKDKLSNYSRLQKIALQRG